MIFVTVGTHEQPFNRLIKNIDNLKKNKVITEDVIIQAGYSTYIPQYCEWGKLYPYHRMLELVNKARIVITHGGPASFIMPLQIGKIPIVVPRQKKYGEHINNHQMIFCRQVAIKMKKIIVVEDMDNIIQVLSDYDAIISGMKDEGIDNNASFNSRLKEIIDTLF